MPIVKEVTVTREVTTTVTDTKQRTLEVTEFRIRANGPDAGEVSGRTNVLENGVVVSAFDWVVPKEQALAVGVPNGLYALLQTTLYGFPQVTTPPNE